jgi:hypothetical protein
MPSNQDYDKDDEEHNDDDKYKLPPPRRTRFSTPNSDKSPKYDDAGLNSMLGNLAISPCSATVAACRNSRGPAVDADAPLHDSQTLYSLVAKFANVYALDPDNQAIHPPSVHAFYVNGCEVKDANTKIDKLVVMMQVANPDDIEYVTGKLSNDKKLILIQALDISPWIVDNQEVIATSLAKKFNPTVADEV